jgi:hypothetical protein
MVDEFALMASEIYTKLNELSNRLGDYYNGRKT